MIIKYCTSDEICVAQFDDISFKDGVLTLTPSNSECFSVIIKDLSSAEVDSIFYKAFFYLKIDLSMYKDKTFLVD